MCAAKDKEGTKVRRTGQTYVEYLPKGTVNSLSNLNKILGNAEEPHFFKLVLAASIS